MILHDCPQNSDEWRRRKTGVVSASSFPDVMTKGRKKGDKSLVRQTYMRKVACEIITGDPAPGFYSKDTERGHEDEPKAIDSYQKETGNLVTRPGFITLDCGRVGCSPDAMVGRDVVECKSKLGEKHIAILMAQEVPKDYKWQVNGQMWVCESDWCDFVSYSDGLPLVVIRQDRDDKIIKELKEEVEKFIIELDDMVDFIQSKS